MTKSRAQATGGGGHPGHTSQEEEKETRKRADGETLSVNPFKWFNPACVLVP